MVKLIGEFMNVESNENPNTGKTSLYLKVLDLEASDVKSVKIPSLEKYKGLKRGDIVELPIKVSSYKDRIYYQEA